MKSREWRCFLFIADLLGRLPGLQPELGKLPGLRPYGLRPLARTGGQLMCIWGGSSMGATGPRLLPWMLTGLSDVYLKCGKLSFICGNQLRRNF